MQQVVRTRAFCLADDRPSAEVGLRLLLLSLAEHGKATPTILFRPGSAPEFLEWCRQWPWLEIIPERPQGVGLQWNCKPQALRPLLARGFREVVWLDSDIILQGSLEPSLAGLDEETLVLAEDTPVTNMGEFSLEARTRAWGWPVVREPMNALNTCVIRVTSIHLPLLDSWERLMQESRYQDAARRPVGERPPYLTSDQDLIMALLGGPEYGKLKLRWLKTGAEVLHCTGLRSFSLTDRWRATTRGPAPVVHAMADKPWNILSDRFGRNRRERLTQFAHEISPFVTAARPYRDRLGIPAPWLGHRTVAGQWARWCGLASPGLAGLPLSLVTGLLAKRAPG